jgi:hypothetical protein
MGTTIEVDYVIKGAGAVGMAFADSLFTETDATIAIVEHRDRAGGHWNDAYPFVRLHQPSSSYGVNSEPLGAGMIDQSGPNQGYFELASGQEVVAHFDAVLRHRFLPSGRVQFFPLSDLADDGTITSLLSGTKKQLRARRFVDSTHSQMQIPSTTPTPFLVSEGVDCVPVNDLPRLASRFNHFTVIGAGKTGMDVCTWLLQNGAEPESIRWVMPRDSWVLQRGRVQPGDEFFATFCKSLADQADAAAHAESVDDLFARLEDCGEIARIDPNVAPAAYHCALLSERELAGLRRIKNVVRLGRVTSIDRDAMHLDNGSVASQPGTLYVDCSAAGIPSPPSTPVFDGDRITPQWIRTCQPTFSGALIGFIEATFHDEVEKNRICTPIVPPTVPGDWMRIFLTELGSRDCWREFPQIGDWIASSRLDSFSKTSQRLIGVDSEATAHFQRYLTSSDAAIENLGRLLADAVTTETAR